MIDLNELKKKYKEFENLNSENVNYMHIVGAIDRAIAAESECDELKSKLAELSQPIANNSEPVDYVISDEMVKLGVDYYYKKGSGKFFVDCFVKELFAIMYAAMQVTPNKAEVPSDKILIDKSLVRFLNGEIPLENNYSKIWFGAHDVKPYWWRKLLPELPPLKGDDK